MAAPVDAGRAVTNVSTAATAHTINLPASIAAGDLIIVATRFPFAPGAITFTGYTEWITDTTDASDDVQMIFYRWADGNEGTSDLMTMPTSAKGAHIAWRITGAQNPAERVPDISAVAVGTGANPDPGSVTPGAGTDDYLFIEVAGLDGETQTFSASTNYSNIQNGNSGTGGAAASNVRIGGATRGITGTSAAENPGTMTAAAPSTGWTARTICIKQPNTQKAGTDSATGTDASAQYPVVARAVSEGGASSSTGLTYPTSGANVNKASATQTWTTPGNITGDGGGVASNGGVSQFSHWLYASGFGLSIPAGATIEGVEVQLDQAYHATSAPGFGGIHLTKTGVDGSESATSYAWINDNGLRTYASSAEKWGYGSITPAEANSSTFGVFFWCGDDAASWSLNVDAVRVNVYYSFTMSSESAVTALQGPPPVADSATGSEALGDRVFATTPDSGTATEASALAILASETGTGSDVSAIATVIGTTDVGYGLGVVGPSNATTGTFEGASGVNWTNPSNNLTDNGLTTEVTLLTSQNSKNLIAKGFGFSMPTRAKPTGVEFKINDYDNGGGSNKGIDVSIRLDDIPRTTGGKTSSVTSGGDETFGGPNDLWPGGNSLSSSAQVNSVDFGILAGITNDTGVTKTFKVDALYQMKVWYGEYTAAPTVVLTVSDSGAGADSVTAPTVALPVTDTGAGTEATGVVTVPISATDTGTGDDVSTLAVVHALTDTGAGADVATVVAVLSAFDVGQEVTVPLIAEQSDWDPAWPTWSSSAIDSITAENDGAAASVTVPATGDMLSEDLQYRDWYVDAPTGWDAWSGGRVYVLATIASTGGVGGGALQIGLVKTGLTGGWAGSVSPDPTPPFSGRYLFEIPVRGGDPNGDEATYILTPAAVASTGFGVDFAVYTSVGGGTTTVAIDKVSLVARPSLDSGAVTAQVSVSDTGTGSENVTVFTRDGITDSGTLSGEVAVTASADATPVNTTDTGSGTDSTVAPTVNFTSSVVGTDYGGNPWDYGQPLQSFTSVTNSDWGAYPEWTNATTAALQSADGNVVSVTAGPDTFSEDLRVLNWGISAQGDRVQHVYVEFSAEVPFPGTNRSILYIQLTRDGGSTGFRTFSLQAPLSGPMTIRFDVTGNNLTRSQVESANFGVLFYLDTPVPEGGQASIEYVKLGLKYEQEVVSLDRSQSPVTDTGAGSDSGLVTQYKDVTDSGTDTEVSDLVAVTATTETGAGADVSTLVAGLAATDSGAGVDSGLFDAAAYSVTDTGSANDAVAAPDAVLTASDTGAGVDSSLLDTGSGTAVSASDSGAGSEVISFFEMVTGDMGGTQDSQGTETHSYTDYLRGASWTPAGNADWVDAEPWAMNGTFPYSNTYAEAVLPPFGVTDYLQVYDFDFFSDNLPPFAEDWGHPAGTIKLAVLSILAKTVEGTGVTLEARLKRATGSSGNYLSWAVPSTATWYDIEGLVVGPPREGWTQVWNVPAATANPGEWDHPKFGFEISAYNNVNATRTLRIESVQAYIIITHPRQENSNVSIAVSDSGSGTEAAGSVVQNLFGTDSGSATEASALTVSSTDDGAGTESSAVSNVVSATETTSGADVSILAALLGLTDTGSATESVQPSRSVGDSGVGTESLGSRVFASTELISVLDLGDANWWLAGAPTDNTLALTATSAGTETLVPYSAGTETLAAASSVTTEVLTAASTDTGLNLNPIDYEPQ